MRAAQVTAMGGPDVLRIAELPDPTPGPGDLLIRVEAAGVGPWDTKMREGEMGPQKTPYIPGAELAGTVAGLGANVDGFAAGDAVWAYPGLQGATAELVVVPAAVAARRPARLSPVDAGGAPVGVMTADEALDTLALAAGETILILAAGGNVGAFAVQLDPLGGDARVTALGLVRDGGRAMTLIPGNLPDAPRGITLASMGVKPDGQRLARLAGMFDAGELRPDPGPTFPLDQIADAHRAYEGHVDGKVVVQVG